ncbi:MAG: SPOR domain-containing protein [Bacteroidota bacterium]|jgi:cell division septation protein DedD
MPFDFKDHEEEPQEQAPQRPQPILHKPRGSAFPIRKLVFVLLGIIVLGAAGFLAMKTGILKKKRPEPPKIVETVTPQKPDSAALAAAQQPPPQPVPTPNKVEPKKPEPKKEPVKKAEIAKPEKQPPKVAAEKQPPKTKPVKQPPAPKKETIKENPPPKVVKPAPVPGGSGDYTIFIGSYKEKALADDEASRWNEAGYPAFVTDKNGWHRVSLGKYTSKNEARQQAEKLKDAFESGYYIDHF